MDALDPRCWGVGGLGEEVKQKHGEEKRRGGGGGGGGGAHVCMKTDTVHARDFHTNVRVQLCSWVSYLHFCSVSVSRW